MKDLRQLWSFFRRAWVIFFSFLIVVGAMQLFITNWLPGLGVFILIAVIFYGGSELVKQRKAPPSDSAWGLFGGIVGVIIGFII